MGVPDKIVGRFDYYNTVYADLLTELQKDIDLSIMINGKIKKANNCKLLTDTLAKYKLKDA